MFVDLVLVDRFCSPHRHRNINILCPMVLFL